MACADDPDCVETLEHLDELIDAAMTLERYQQLQRHLEECPPCLEQFVLYQDLRWKVADACGCQHAPEALRAQILSSITEVTVVRSNTGTAVSWQQTTQFGAD